MASFRPHLSEPKHALREPLLGTLAVVVSLIWLGLLIITEFNALTVSAGLAGMVYLTVKR